MKSRTGIYQITNTTNNKFYIGSSVDMRRRISNHKIELRNNKHCNRHLQRAWNKYGEESFEFRWVLICDKENLFYYEQLLLDVLEPDYNISTCAEVSGRGQKQSPEVVAKRSGVNSPMYGTHLSEDARAKLSSAHKGNQYGLGYKHTEEARIKMSAMRKGKPFTEDHRFNIANAQIGRVVSEETRAKISASKTGVALPPRTEEHCRNISASLRRHYGSESG